MASTPSSPSISSLPPTKWVEAVSSLTQANPKVRALIDAMIASWGKGVPLLADEVLASNPELQADGDIVLRLIVEEMGLRQEADQVVETSDYTRRFPALKAEIEALVECQLLLERQVSQELAGSQPDSSLGDFQILAELGKGGHSRVYLATQPYLGNRPVVLKITPCRGREHLSLARLQHTHIVPLYWAQDHPKKQQRILCMPYFGGTSLAHLLHTLKTVPFAERTGKQILQKLDQAEHPLLSGRSSHSQAPARQLLARIAHSYVLTIVWMGSCLAEALQYAHEHGLLHLDVKPANVLWTRDGQPMLLDFHLAHHPFGPETAKPVGLGGTPGYMSPEQEAGLQALGGGKPITQAVDGRADIFSLGVLLYQALGGTVPLPSPPPRLETINPRVSPGLADIIERCLASKREDRYPTAELLARDLRRHLSDLPLQGVNNRSWSESWYKWRRREPYGMVILLLFAIVGTAAGWAWSHYRALREHRAEVIQENHRRLSEFLEQGKKHIKQHQYDLALTPLEAGSALPPQDAEAQVLVQSLKEQLRLVQSVQYLRAAVDTLRLSAILEPLPREQRLEINTKCRSLWEQRAHYLPATEYDPQVRQDVIDLVLIWSEFAPDGALSEPLGEVDQLWGPNHAVHQAMARKGTSRGPFLSGTMVVNPPLNSAWERIAWARTLIRRSSDGCDPIRVGSACGGFGLLQGCSPGLISVAPTVLLWEETESQRLRWAAYHLQQAVKQDPKNEWAYYYQGICAHRRNRWHDARQAFSLCIALAPQRASSFYHRGLACTQLDDLDAALDDYSQALVLNPHFGNAALNRALVHARMAHYQAAHADLDYAQKHGVCSKQVSSNRLLIQKLQGRSK